MGQIQPPPYILRIFLPSSTVGADVQLSRQGLRVRGVLWLEPFGCCHRRNGGARIDGTDSLLLFKNSDEIAMVSPFRRDNFVGISTQ